MNAFLDSAGIWLPGATIMVVLTAASALFSAGETALFYLSRDDLRRMQTGHAGERLAASLLKNPDRLLTVILFWNLIVNLSCFAVSLVVAKKLLDAGYPAVAGAVSLLGLVAIILLGEVVPKSLAVLFRRQLAILVSVPLALAARVVDPLLPVLNATTAALRRVLFPNLKREPYLEVDDIERAVESSELGVEMVRLEQQILGRILELSDMTAEEIMRPRGTYPVWRPPLHLEDLQTLESLPEYLLLAEDDQETVTGAIPLYELNSLPAKHLETVSEEVIFVPWCATVSETLTQLRTHLVSVAAVINEYGDVIGILTQDDIFDTLLNPRSSRGKRVLEREPVTILPDGAVLAEGLTTMRHLAQQLGIDHEIEDDAPLTVVALMHQNLERFPLVGDECLWEGCLLRVVQAGEPGEAIQVSVNRLQDS